MTAMTDPAGDLQIVPLTRERLPDLAQLFGEGGDPKWCWNTLPVDHTQGMYPCPAPSAMSARAHAAT
jgi:hypothetical protein